MTPPTISPTPRCRRNRSDAVLISEIFYSIQGEGELTGVPSVFVRTSGCNLRCKWCDTPYASWKPEGLKMSIDEIVAEVKKHQGARHVVLTGGEPMIAPTIHDLAETLKREQYHITIETAGTVPPEGIACDLASISPKLSNSTPELGAIDATWIERHDQTRQRPEVLKEWITNYHYQFKFVIGAETDLAEVLRIKGSDLSAVPPWKIQLMPEGIDSPTIAKHRSLIINFCQESGFRFCDRLHIHLFGNTRGT